MNICFEGGGVTCFASVGAIIALEELGMREQYEHFVGTSAGALVAFMMHCGLSGDQIRQIVAEFDYSDLKDDSLGIIRDISRFVNSFGWFKGKSLRKMIRIVFERCGVSIETTFAELQKQFNGNTFGCVAVAVQNRMAIYYHVKTSPDENVYDAIICSMNLPFIWPAIYRSLPNYYKEKAKYPVDLIIDGGLLDNFPIDFLPGPTLGILVSTGYQSDLPPVENIIDYAKCICDMISRQNSLAKSDYENVININVGDQKSTNFDITSDEINTLIDIGYITVLQYYGIDRHDIKMKSKCSCM